MAAALVVVIIVASMAAAVRNQYPAYSVGLQNLNALAGKPCGIADGPSGADANAGLLQPSATRGISSRPGRGLRSRPTGLHRLTATQAVDTDTPGTGEDDTTSTTAGTEGGVRWSGSAAVTRAPVRLTRSRCPCRQPTGAQLARDHHRLVPAARAGPESPLVTIAVAGTRL